MGRAGRRHQFLFLRGASHPSDMIYEAHRLGMKAIGIADRNTVAGVVRAYVAIRDALMGGRNYLLNYKKAHGLPEVLSANEELALSQFDVRLVVGARLVFSDGTPDIIAYPKTRKGWGRLTRLLTIGNLRAEKGCILGLSDLLAHLDDMCLIVVVQPFHVTNAQQSAPLISKRYTDNFKPEQFGAAELFEPRAPGEAMSREAYAFLLRSLARAAPGDIWARRDTRF